MHRLKIDTVSSRSKIDLGLICVCISVKIAEVETFSSVDQLKLVFMTVCTQYVPANMEYIFTITVSAKTGLISLRRPGLSPVSPQGNELTRGPPELVQRL